MSQKLRFVSASRLLKLFYAIWKTTENILLAASIENQTLITANSEKLRHFLF